MIWILPLLGCIVAAFFLLDSILGTKSAVQQGAEAAVASACVVIPYVFARAVQEMGLKWPSPAEPSDRKFPYRMLLRAALYSVGFVVVVAAIGAIASYISDLPDGPSGPAVEKACKEFKPTYDTLSAPTTEQLKIARNCRLRGYWK